MKTQNPLVVISLFILSLCSIVSASCSPSGSFKISAIPEDQTLKERIVCRDSGWVSDRVAIIDINGVIMNATESKFMSDGEHFVSLIVEKMNAAAQDDRVKAVILRINSPGGSVTASDILYNEILAFRAATGKPVIAYFQDVAASGAYYLACAADEIVAEQTCITGSIGVIMIMVDLSGTMSKLGIGADAIKSGPMKDAGSPFRTMQPEERRIFQGLVDSFYHRFVDVVGRSRCGLTHEQILTLADGRIYSAEQAKEAGLIDRIATLPETIKLAKEKAKIDKANIVLYHRPLEWRPSIYAQAPAGASTTINLLNIELSENWTQRPTFMYIWSIGG